MDDKLLQHGAFSWFELTTSDTEAAKEFYTGLLGWEVREMPMQDMTYTVIRVGGEDVAGIMGTPPGAENMPPQWSNYITVDNVDATAAKAKELGGSVLVEPRDIPEVGRFCVIRDPQGACFSVMTYKS